MADKQSVGVWEFPKGPDEEIDDLAGKIAGSMAVELERQEQSPPS
jgi:hypothetical protein